MTVYEVPHVEPWPIHSIICIAATDAIEVWSFTMRESIELFPSGLLCWPVEFTY